MQTNNPSNYTQYSTEELEQLLRSLSDQGEINSVLDELRKRFQNHYSRHIKRSNKTSSKTASSSEFRGTTRKTISLDFPNTPTVEELPERGSYTEAVGQGIRYGLVLLLLVASIPVWLFRIILYPKLTLSKFGRLILAILSMPIILLTSIIVAPLKLLLLLLTAGQINMFEDLVISRYKDLYDWVAPNGFWKE